jgi:4-amino-4-deoxy-L-arabinose transferase-like glycosyltransferase
MGKKKFFILLFILFLASFFRLWKLGEIPPGLYPDVAINGNEAFFSLKQGDFKIFYPENYGREGLFIWLIALSFSIFGVSIWSIRIVSVFIGILTVLGIFFFSKEIFKSVFSKEKAESLALLSSFFLSFFFWHVNFSRIGFRAILLPFFLTFSFYFLWKALWKKSLLYSAISGLFFGLGFYSYTPFRLAVLILPFLFLPFWFLSKREKSEKRFFLIFFLFLFVTFIIALPIGIYFLENPQSFISRATPITIFKAENPTEEFFKSLVLHLGMFNFYGDPNWRHNFSKRPQLPFLLGILFLIGILFAGKECFEVTQKKEWKKASIHWLTLSWFFVMLLPGVLTREGIPHSLRTIGVVCPVFIFVALGTEKVFVFLKNKINHKKFLIFVFLFFFLICAFLEFQKYFFVWAKKPEVKGEFTKELVEMGKYLNSLPQESEKYVIVNRPGVPVSWARNLPMPSQTIMFLEISEYGEIKSNYLLPEEIDKIKIEKEGVILPLNFDEKTFEKLKEKFPRGKIRKIKDFSVYEIGK